MLTYLTLQLVHDAAHRVWAFGIRLILIDANLLTGLALFGLASNGACLSALSRASHAVSKSGAVSREATVASGPAGILDRVGAAAGEATGRRADGRK